MDHRLFLCSISPLILEGGCPGAGGAGDSGQRYRQGGLHHTPLVGHFARIASLYAQLERWQGQARALTPLEQALELLC